MFNTLADRLGKIFDKLKSRGILTADMVDESLREIKVALLEADVALSVVKTFMQSVKEKAVGQNIIKSVQPAQQVVKIVSDTLIETLGNEGTEIAYASCAPTVIMLVGLQGSGKTTSAAKLARRLKKDGKTVLMASLDVYRPAAQEQLAGLGEQTEIPTLEIIKGQKPEEIAKRALKEAAKTNVDVLILDTAGRLHIDDEMMAEIKKIEQITSPNETLIVVDSMVGQDAVSVAQAFGETLKLTGIVLTRVDGDSRGGAALSMRQLTGCPIKFLGVGEKTDALEVFDAKRVADRILGMGDVVGLVETALEKVNKEEAEAQAMRMLQGRFNLNDMLAQLRQMQSLGDIKSIALMIPGMSKFRDKIEQSGLDNSFFKRQEAIILSMTPYERKVPDVLKASRKLRIAKGAGVTVNEVNKLLKQYEQMATVMKKFKKMGPFGAISMMKKMSSMMKGNGLDLMKSGDISPYFNKNE